MKKNLTDIAASLQAAIGTATVPHVPAPPPTPPADSGAKVAFRAEGMAPPDRQGQAEPYDGKK